VVGGVNSTPNQLALFHSIGHIDRLKSILATGDVFRDSFIVVLKTASGRIHISEVRSSIMPDLISAKPIFSFSRKGATEVVVHGIVALKRQGVILSGNGAGANIVTRSLLKPWQAMATGGFTADHKFWALGVASHSGQPHHHEQLNELMSFTGAKESDLVCPRTFPLDAAAAATMRAAGQSVSRLNHPCAGKHLLMLSAARNESAPIESYWHEDHPVQKRIQALVGKEASEKLTWVTDSCGLPVAAMPVRALMNMYERFALDPSEVAMNLKTLWLDNPSLVGGGHRLDTDICEWSKKRLIAKEGADGLLMVQSLPSVDGPVMGCFVKISSGHNVAHIGLALWCLLSSQSDLSAPMNHLRDYLKSRLEEWVPKDQTLQNLYRG
jgi:L-asparaginase II